MRMCPRWILSHGCKLVNRIGKSLPLLQLVIIESSVNSNQQRGSLSVTFDCIYFLVLLSMGVRYLKGSVTMTGGNMAVAALGTTECSMLCSSSLSADRLEFDLNRFETVV